jgi:hypothetical protein
MSLLITVDPGLRGSGCSLWYEKKLIKAAYVKNPIEKGNGPYESNEMAKRIHGWQATVCRFAPVNMGFVQHLVLEYPRTYGGRAGRGDANDLFPLAAIDGALAAHFGMTGAQITRFFPRDWKGTTEKPENTKTPYVVEGMVRRRLDPTETKILDAEWPNNVKHTYDITDSVGIGLTALGRFEKIRVYARE